MQIKEVKVHDHLAEYLSYIPNILVTASYLCLYSVFGILDSLIPHCELK